MTKVRDTLLLAVRSKTIRSGPVADYAYALANDGGSEPNYSWLDQYIIQATQKGVRFGCGYARGRCDCKKCLSAINASREDGRE